MAGITGTLVKNTEFAGAYKLVTVTANLSSSSDEIAFAQATHGITTVVAILGCVITGGMDADLMTVKPTIDANQNLVTVASYNATGSASGELDNATIALTVLGSD